MPFPQLKIECLTTGCSVIIDRWTSDDPRFCRRCRKMYGQEMAQVGIEIYYLTRMEEGYPETDYDQRLRDGFEFFGGDDNHGD